MSSCVFAVSHVVFFFFLMIRRPPRSTLSSSSAASDVYKRQTQNGKHKDVVDDHDNDGSDDKLQGASQDSYASLLFTLQGALLRNSPESLVGAVGDTSHHPTFIAVRLLTTIYYRHYLPNEALRSSPVSYTHLRAHETPEHLVCRLLLEKKKKTNEHCTTTPIDVTYNLQ
eukprot:TRINITY_DN12233_c0_g1_i2.p1 TRINITY_DN12233_c0_g1~~TRINITY_DN12233_c0_g1_i2.p1  ORF type:complete len:170 (+),score=50.31 TRINITY_DN12233_c0_g1_i2:66-575(+)